MDKPTIGRIVWYRSRTGKYTVPAIITATKDTLIEENVEKGYIEGLTDQTHVHLTVFTPGKPGKRGDANDFEARPDAPISENVAGCYQEWDVPQHTGAIFFDYEKQPAGTWMWPERA